MKSNKVRDLHVPLEHRLGLTKSFFQPINPVSYFKHECGTHNKMTFSDFITYPTKTGPRFLGLNKEPIQPSFTVYTTINDQGFLGPNKKHKLLGFTTLPPYTNSWITRPIQAWMHPNLFTYTVRNLLVSTLRIYNISHHIPV